MAGWYQFEIETWKYSSIGDVKNFVLRWRKKVNGTSNGAFKGMKAILFTTPAKRGSYQRLITAGGGIVLPSVL
jgi:hypothetical protein